MSIADLEQEIAELEDLIREVEIAPDTASLPDITKQKIAKHLNSVTTSPLPAKEVVLSKLNLILVGKKLQLANAKKATKAAASIPASPSGTSGPKIP